jgi:membrane protein YdbS with pleckstrin-like domain
MADRDPATGRGADRHGADVVGLVLGMIFLVIAAVGFTGNLWWLSANIAWIAAGAVALIGVALLVSTLPRGESKD